MIIVLLHIVSFSFMIFLFLYFISNRELKNLIEDIIQYQDKVMLTNEITYLQDIFNKYIDYRLDMKFNEQEQKVSKKKNTVFI